MEIKRDTYASAEYHLCIQAKSSKSSLSPWKETTDVTHVNFLKNIKLYIKYTN